MKTAPLTDTPKRIRKGQKSVVLTKGATMTAVNYLGLVPPPEFGRRGERWTASKKDDVVKAIKAGFMSVDDAVNRWNVTGITEEEVSGWLKGSRHGLDGLKVTKIQKVGEHAR